jgi:hypothetical protein
MLAHKARYEGKLAVEVILGERRSTMSVRCRPSAKAIGAAAIDLVTVVLVIGHPVDSILGRVVGGGQFMEGYYGELRATKNKMVLRLLDASSGASSN